jgi:hypothetical protein
LLEQERLPPTVVTLWDSLISCPSSLAFFPSAFFAAFSYRFASLCPDLYSCNVFSSYRCSLIAASYTEIASGSATLGHLDSLHGTKRGTVAPGIFEAKSDH